MRGGVEEILCVSTKCREGGEWAEGRRRRRERGTGRRRRLDSVGEDERRRAELKAEQRARQRTIQAVAWDNNARLALIYIYTQLSGTYEPRC